jgi:hypothetical protein
VMLLDFQTSRSAACASVASVQVPFMVCWVIRGSLVIRYPRLDLSKGHPVLLPYNTMKQMQEETYS